MYILTMYLIHKPGDGHEGMTARAMRAATMRAAITRVTTMRITRVTTMGTNEQE
jgi:hypothetical protein